MGTNDKMRFDKFWNVGDFFELKEFIDIWKNDDIWNVGDALFAKWMEWDI